MKKVIVAIPHSHTWLWTQTCVSSLKMFPPIAEYGDQLSGEPIEWEIVVVDNSWDWSPAIRGIRDTRLGHGVTILDNPKPNKFHASALDAVIDAYPDMDYLLALETDVCALRADWLGWFLKQMHGNIFAVGHWHHEQFVNPSCTLYRGDVLRTMNDWCKASTSTDLRWGENFEQILSVRAEDLEWIGGAFADKRGWPEGTQLKERPSGQTKGHGWYEPGQMLHHWAVNEGYDYVVCQTATTHENGAPVQTFYGMDKQHAPSKGLDLGEMWNLAYTVHLWGGTRALDIIKHDVTDNFVKSHIPFWLEREAKFWLQCVDKDVREQTIELIREHGWHTKGCGHPDITDRDRKAGEMATEFYRQGGVEI